jgi:hypothetical protein
MIAGPAASSARMMAKRLILHAASMARSGFQFQGSNSPICLAG